MSKTLLLALPCLLASALPAQNWRNVKVGEADRKAPNLVRWQRRLSDAEALSRRTGVPLLICVNMDGESACEVYAHRKYKDETFAALTRGFVPVIASPTRHNAKDYDERGRRVVCPRFGTVTCGEHISIEPYLYAKYFEGKRYAPRHLGISARGEKLFDHFLNQDLSVVSRSLERHGKADGEVDASFDRDAVARTKMEREFLVGDERRRLALLNRARSANPPGFDLIRLGLHDESERVRERAAKTLATTLDSGSVDLVFEALRSGAAEQALKALRRKLAPMAKDDDIAAKALRILAGLDTRSKIVNEEAWTKAISSAGSAESADEPPFRLPGQPDEEVGGRIDRLLQHLEELDRQRTVSPTPELHAETARALLEVAKARMATGSDPTYFLIDAKAAAEAAEDAGAKTYRTAAVRAEAAYLLSEFEDALQFASKALPKHLKLAEERETADLLGVFAQLRARAIYEAEGKGEDWPSSWFSDARSAYEALTRHPHATEAQFSGYSTLLAYFGLERENGDVLRRALARFPLSGPLHQQFRDHVWRKDGPFGLERAYERVDLEDRPAAYTWFRAYASMVYAEHLRRVEKLTESRSAYERAIRLFDESSKLEERFAENSDHFVALALAELAFLALEGQDLAKSGDLIARSLERRPESLRSLDGLGRSPELILQRVLQQLEKSGDDRAVAALKARVEDVVPGHFDEG